MVTSPTPARSTRWQWSTHSATRGSRHDTGRFEAIAPLAVVDHPIVVPDGGDTATAERTVAALAL
ncbi:hypothetical protein [Haloplanus halobius]|uniref:hypothetical protein n=1 Tax=Haloplanus halobius TaxID=2934938 RepID=UPI00200F5471|nr:hypothetical protein [Haloplanus sp. XH21]